MGEFAEAELLRCNVLCIEYFNVN